MGNMSLADKMRRCEEIKSRYKKGSNSSNMNIYVRDNNDERIDESRFTNLNNSNVNINNNNNNNNNNESFMINSGYHSPRNNQ